MLYFLLFLVRYLPFWAIPFSIAIFELGLYFYNRRDRYPGILAFGLCTFLVVSSILWIIFEGYWRGPPLVKEFLGY